MIDLVISGPDMSGTSTQIDDCIEFFKNKNMSVRDIRGTEMDALFHADMFKEDNQDSISLAEFTNDMHEKARNENSVLPLVNMINLNYTITQLLRGGGTNQDLQIASMTKDNGVSTYIDPDSADVWIMEEPTKRGAGQVNRTIEQFRTRYGSELDPLAAAYCHSVYRVDEFLRFRKTLREKNKIIIRSRSEESACYQIQDYAVIPKGPTIEQYLNLPGHKIAFKNSPSNIFIVCAPNDWTRKDYLELKRERSDGRNIDDHEANVDYQLLVNKRYATEWISDLYDRGCRRFNGTMPEIHRFDIYNSKAENKRKMNEKLEDIFNSLS